ncbi:CBS domain-containing protein [Phormidium sp. FACHB-1136]|uniref:CBS domain-containing protein n=1 Tax=Phormidium sp. FACHB-1136 TaxID=2692848 RepID=UPI00168248E3|nr:CBS domain-containing protein [Phormidium sp. FACHB-1136]MBD2427826.1 CBS domain-containing protein [Phormidium sp. FACHB-1136]
MDLVLCHTTADFDTLGAAVGLARLQPGARVVLTGGCHPTVQRFVALHRDEYPLIERRAVNPNQIRSLTLVDAQLPHRFGPAAEWIDLALARHIPITIYDHHPATEKAVPAQTTVIETVGSASTLVVEAMQRQGILPTVAEATVMALGVHVDTGSLLFETATVRDAEALAWLMAQGASVPVIAEFVEPGLTPNLQDLLTAAMEQMVVVNTEGNTLASVLLAVDRYIPGLSGVAERLISLADVDALLFGAHYPGKDLGPDGETPLRKLLLIGRAQGRVSFKQDQGHDRGQGIGQKSDQKLSQRFGQELRQELGQGIDWGSLFTTVGGGGHPTAASATLTTDAPEQVMKTVLSQARLQFPKPPTARDLMSSPVRTIRPETTIGEAQRILLRYGHSGLSVVDATDALVGVISRRDLDIALHHGFSHAPVKGYMATNLKTITPETSLSEIEELMVTYDIGRLPVLQDKALVGIVTRTDLLRHLHQVQRMTGSPRPTPGQPQLPPVPPLTEVLAQHLKPSLWEILTQISTAAQDRGWHLYLVGGAVRDLLIQRDTVPATEGVSLPDLDLVVDGFYQTAQVGAGMVLAEHIKAQFPEVDIQVHGRFQTASLVWRRELDHPLAGLMIDIATARTEFYPYPAANPEVEASSIQQDLYRRDFTINAMALRLTNPGQGQLLDYFGGLIDLHNRQVRVLHPNSFIEDPTRIYRAVRFAVRLGFSLDSQTEGYIHHAIDSGVYAQMQRQVKRVPALQVRLKNELKYILEAHYWPGALELLDHLRALRCIHGDLAMTPALWHQLRRVSRWLDRFDWAERCSPWQLRLEVLLATLPPGQRHDIAAALQLTETSIQRLAHLDDLETTWLNTITPALRPSQRYATFAPVDLATLLLVSARHPRTLGPVIWRYLTLESKVVPLVNGETLKTLGYKPGRQFSPMLAALLAAQLDGDITTLEEAQQFLVQHYPLSPAPPQKGSRQAKVAKT